MKYIMAALVAAAVILCFRATNERMAVWKDETSLWTATMKTNPDSPDVNYNLGIALVGAGSEEEGYKYLLKSKKLNPDFHKSYIGLAAYYRKKGDLTKAFKILKEGLSRDPQNLELHYNIAVVYFEQEAWRSVLNIMGSINQVIPDYKDSKQYMFLSLEKLQEEMDQDDFKKQYGGFDSFMKSMREKHQ